VGDIVLVDVIPLTVGLETLGGVLTTLIARNTAIPTEKTEVFTTAADGQTSVDIHVLQGERPMASDNKSIGRFMLDGVLPAPRGIPKIEVKFDINGDGILSVSARDKGTGKEQKIVIQSGSGLAKEEIERMVNEAKANEQEDQRRRTEVETRNQADSMVYSAEKTLEDNKDKLPQELKEEVEAKVATLKSAIASNNLAEMQPAMTELTNALQQLGQAVYSQAGDPSQTMGNGPVDGGPSDAGPSADGPSDEGPQDGDSTVEGEFREV